MADGKFLGRFMLGEWLPIEVLTYDSSRDVAWATDGSANIISPFFRIYDTSFNNIISHKQLAAVNPDQETGYYRVMQRLGPEFSTGQHLILVEWADAAANENKTELQSFWVIAGGDDDGHYVGLHYYERPDSVHIVGVTDAGLIESRRNPRL